MDEKMTARVPEEEGLTVDEALKKLDEIVAQLENGDLSLEDSFRLYERGMKLAAKCDGMISSIEDRVRMITEDGEISDASL